MRESFVEINRDCFVPELFCEDYFDCIAVLIAV